MVWGYDVRMYDTAELRWFHEGRAPAGVVAWFSAGGREPTVQPVRVDHYLHLVDSQHLGVKVREGRLEVKHRRGNSHAVHLGPCVSGLIEQWRKWSIPLAANPDAVPPRRRATVSWIEVVKERALCRYWLAGDRRIVATSTDWYPDEGCDVELTVLRVRGRAWWTLALEAYGPCDSVCENLLSVAELIFDASEPPALHAADSYAYPRWLELVG